MLPTYGLCLAGWLYVGLTWHEPHRVLMAAMFAIGVVSTLTLGRLPMDRIVRSRWCETFFVDWSAGDIALTEDPQPARVVMGLASLGLAPAIGFLHDRERRALKLSARAATYAPQA